MHAGRDGLLGRSSLRYWMLLRSKPNSTKEESCMWVWRMLILTSKMKLSPVGVSRKLGGGVSILVKRSLSRPQKVLEALENGL
ncbi:hypothetical protein AVEN_4888-1 [Araneus ventricosus]|uniref:Uncharacterized protein n=1 Tax=Araneus ventricosus TaxID=182803 RepID=A0A4Y2UA26_ARAVE|nr:hypothetical protein AVEN_4888-1 [Araneus ventricosus]